MGTGSHAHVGGEGERDHNAHGQGAVIAQGEGTAGKEGNPVYGFVGGHVDAVDRPVHPDPAYVLLDMKDLRGGPAGSLPILSAPPDAESHPGCQWEKGRVNLFSAQVVDIDWAMRTKNPLFSSGFGQKKFSVGRMDSGPSFCD